MDAPSPEARAEAATVVAREFARGGFTEQEAELAVAILETLSTEGEDRIRESMSELLNACPDLPKTVARNLAGDALTSVAVPVLRANPVLDDDDLIEILQDAPIAHQVAVAKREEVSPEVAEALLESRDEKVVGALLGNHGADLPSPLLNRVLDDFGSFSSFHSLLAERPFLPLTVTARLMLLIPDEERDKLLERHELPARIALDFSRVIHETCISRDAARLPKAVEATRLVQAMQQQNNLPPILVLRGLIIGDLELFESALAEKTQMTVEAARTLIYSPSERAFKGLYQRSELPSDLLRAFRIALNYIAEIGRDNAEFWRAEDSLEVLKRLGEDYDEVCPVELRRLMGRLQRRLARDPETAGRGSVELAFSKSAKDSKAFGRRGSLRPAG